MSRPERNPARSGATSRTSAANGESSAIGLRSAAAPCYGGNMVTRALPRSRPGSAFNGVKVFSATMFADRERLGERVTHWLAEHPGFEIVEMKVTQSSDAAFHCLAISVFYLERIRSRVDP